MLLIQMFALAEVHVFVQIHAVVMLGMEHRTAVNPFVTESWQLVLPCVVVWVHVNHQTTVFVQMDTSVIDVSRQHVSIFTIATSQFVVLMDRAFSMIDALVTLVTLVLSAKP